MVEVSLHKNLEEFLGRLKETQPTAQGLHQPFLSPHETLVFYPTLPQRFHHLSIELKSHCELGRGHEHLSPSGSVGTCMEGLGFK